MVFQPWHVVGSVLFVECGHCDGRGKSTNSLRILPKQIYKNYDPHVQAVP